MAVTGLPVPTRTLRRLVVSQTRATFQGAQRGHHRAQCRTPWGMDDRPGGTSTPYTRQTEGLRLSPAAGRVRLGQSGSSPSATANLILLAASVTKAVRRSDLAVSSSSWQPICVHTQI